MPGLTPHYIPQYSFQASVKLLTRTKTAAWRLGKPHMPRLVVVGSRSLQNSRQGQGMEDCKKSGPRSREVHCRPWGFHISQLGRALGRNSNGTENL